VIKEVARALAAAVPDCTAEEIADMLWLAGALPAAASPDSDEVPAPEPVSDVPASPPEDAGRPQADQLAVMLTQEEGPISGGLMVPATAVGLRAPAAMRRPLSTARVFSLFKRIRRPGPPEVDIDATVEATADARRLTVVTRPGRERGLDVALVADTSLVMTVYGEVLAQFEALLLRAGAFRSVSRWTLVPDAEVQIRDRAGVEHHPDRLIDPSGRRLVLLVTDAAADHWYRAAVWQALRHWAEVMPTAVIHVLPEQYRAQGPLGSSAIGMRSRRPGGPNRAADVEVAWWDPDDAADGAMPIPVVGMSPSELAVWAQAVAAGTGWVDAVWTRPPPGRSARAANADLSAEDRVRAFQARASRGAQALARVLAGAPVLSLPLIGVLQARLVPGTGPSELAEVLVGGLLERVTASAGGTEDAQFRFRPSVSDLLSRGTTATQEWSMFEAVSDYLERNAGTGNAIHALLADPHGLAWVDAGLEPFAALGRSVATRLGLAPAGGIEAGTEEPEQPAPGSSPADSANRSVLEVRYAVRSDVGLIAEGNEDSAYAGPRLLAVADGGVGPAAGEVASALTIASMAELDTEQPGGDMLTALSMAVATANARLQEKIVANPAVEGMSTTLTALLWSDGRTAVCHIGNSRGYLLRDGELYQITHDHTLVQSLVDEGRISADDVSTHPQRSQLHRVLDGRSIAEPDLSVHESLPGDRYLLCSDGLSGVVSDETLLDTLSDIEDPEVATRQLIELAIRGGGPDNITCIVADVVDTATSRWPPTTAPVLAGAAATLGDLEAADGNDSFGDYEDRMRPARTAPQPVAEPPDEKDLGISETLPPLVEGVYCKNGHFNDPEARWCAVCGISMGQVTKVRQLGPRPPLGVLILGDGSVCRLDADYVIGREPTLDSSVAEGRARPLRLTGASGVVSRIHARVELDGWQVFLTDLNSANGTQVLMPGERNPTNLQPGVRTPLVAGAQIRLAGEYGLQYDSLRRR
jgi:serine/threonine protein phosphatase PrpC